MPPTQKHITSHGFTLVEMLIVLTISAILLALGGNIMRGYYLRQQLTLSTQNLVTLLERAQLSTSKGLPICINFKHINTTGSAEVWMFPNNKTENFTETNCSSSYPGIQSVGTFPIFKPNVKLATEGHCSHAVKDTCVMWINSEKKPMLCPTNAYACIGESKPTCTSGVTPYQFVVSHQSLPLGARAKEVEYAVTSLVSTTKLNDKGNIDNVWAAFSGDGNGQGSCE